MTSYRRRQHVSGAFSPVSSCPQWLRHTKLFQRPYTSERDCFYVEGDFFSQAQVSTFYSPWLSRNYIFEAPRLDRYCVPESSRCIGSGWSDLRRLHPSLLPGLWSRGKRFLHEVLTASCCIEPLKPMASLSSLPPTKINQSRPLAELEILERHWVATIVLLVWVKLMDPLQSVFQDFFLLVKMIALMIGIACCYSKLYPGVIGFPPKLL